MKTNQTNSIPECRRLRWPFQRRSAAWLPTLTLCLWGCLLTARGQGDPRITNTNNPVDTNVSVGATVSFRLDASTTNNPVTIQWQFAGTNLPGATRNPLVLTNVTAAHAGGYTAWITNAIGGYTNSRTATLTVDPTFTKMGVMPGSTDMFVPYWVDLTGDGWQELVITGGYWTGGGKPLMVYRNNRDGTLGRDSTNDLAKLTLRLGSIAWADLDSDGLLDAFVGQWEGQTPLYLHNEGGGKFTKHVANASWTANGIGTFGSCVSCADFDHDGILDLIAGYWGNSATGVWGTNTVLHGLGGGRFEVDRTSPLALAHTWAENFSWADWNGDGRLDLYAATSGDANQVDLMFENLGNGQFLKVTNNPLVKIPDLSINAAWGDYNNDGKLDVLVTAFYRTNQLYRNMGDGIFEPDSASPIFPTNVLRGLAIWGDYDNDGWMDLFVSDQNVASRLFHNRGNGAFDEVTTGSPVTEARGYGAAWGDYDNDGFLDLVVAGNDASNPVNYLYRNSLFKAGCTNGWLKVRLVGTASNRSGIGATTRVKATIGGQELWQMRQIVCQNYESALLAHFGLGDATNVTTLRIEWPSGNVQELANVAPNQFITVTEATLITPAMPSVSLNGSVTLTRAVVSGAIYQWRFDGVDLAGQTSRSLNLTNIVAGQEGRYSVVVSNVSTLVTNFVYLHVDTQFTKITQGAIVNDLGYSYWPAWGDYNGDGWLDLFVPNGGNEGLTVQFLYRNDQQGGFVRVTAAEVGTLATNLVDSAQGIWADYDNDGDQDLFIGSALAAPSRLYANEGDGRFTRVTQDGGLNRAPPTWTAAWADYDKDGFLDLYLASGTSTLWRNLGNGSFKQFLGIPFPSNDAINGSWGDADNDGDLDLLVGGFSGNNVFYRNQGNATFKNDASAGLGGGGVVQTLWADFNNDGWLDVFLSGPGYYFQNKKDGTFQRITTGATTYGGLNVSAGDYDNDGDLDLFITRGQGSGDPSLLFRNEGDGTFVSITCGSLTQDRGHFTGCAWADYDNDGALDLVVNTVANEKNSLFHNNGNSNRWLIVRPVGTRSNRDAIGAKVRATATVWGRSTLQTRQIGGGTISDPRAHFGLGNATKATTLRIEWPSGAVQEIPNVAANQILTVYEPPALSAAVRADGACELTIKAEPNQGWQIQASNDLLTWQPLTSVTNTSYQFQFTDPAVPGMISRFYRLQSQ